MVLGEEISRASHSGSTIIIEETYNGKFTAHVEYPGKQGTIKLMFTYSDIEELLEKLRETLLRRITVDQKVERNLTACIIELEEKLE